MSKGSAMPCRKAWEPVSVSKVASAAEGSDTPRNSCPRSEMLDTRVVLNVMVLVGICWNENG